MSKLSSFSPFHEKATLVPSGDMVGPLSVPEYDVSTSDLSPPGATALKILDRGSYGWLEFVTAQGCRSVAEIKQFYEQLGGYLALFYALPIASGMGMTEA